MLSEELRALPELAKLRGYAPHLVATIHHLLTDSPISTIDVRNFLEKFLKASVLLERTIRFDGNLQQRREVTDFAHQRGWLTIPERNVVSSIYGLLSDAGAHPGSSIIDPGFARLSVLYIAWLIAHRINDRPTQLARKLGGSAGQLHVARDFLKEIRMGEALRHEYKFDLDLDLMQLTRQLLRTSDIKPLMEIIGTDNASPTLRCDCASLVLSPRIFQERTVVELDRYCRKKSGSMPWPVERGIVLALANRTNHPDRLLDYLDRVKQRAELLNQNLADSDHYYGSAREAASYYLSRLRNLDIRVGGCMWEAFYLAHRHDKSLRKQIYSALTRRFSTIETPRVRQFWEELIRLVDDRPPRS